MAVGGPQGEEESEILVELGVEVVSALEIVLGSQSIDQREGHESDGTGSAGRRVRIDHVASPILGNPRVAAEKGETRDNRLAGLGCGIVLMDEGETPQGAGLAHLTVAG